MIDKYIYVEDTRYSKSRYIESNKVLYSFYDVEGTRIYKKVRDIR